MSPSAREILRGGVDEAKVSFKKGAVPQLEGKWAGCTRATLYLDAGGEIHFYAKNSEKGIIDRKINLDKDIFTVEE